MPPAFLSRHDAISSPDGAAYGTPNERPGGINNTQYCLHSQFSAAFAFPFLIIFA